VKELLSVAAGYHSCTLVVEKWCGISFQDADIVAEAFEDDAGEEAAEGAADLCFRVRDVWMRSAIGSCSSDEPHHTARVNSVRTAQHHAEAQDFHQSQTTAEMEVLTTTTFRGFCAMIP